MALSAKIPIKRKIFLSHFVAIVLVSGSIGTYFYLSASANLIDSVKSRLLNSAAFISQTLDTRRLESIRNSSDATASGYIDTLKHLRALKTTNKDIEYLYIMRRQGDRVEFVVDTDETDEQAKPGDAYSDPPQELLEGFENPSVDHRIYSDPWGEFMSGYAPLPDGNGRYLVGIDMRASEISKKLRFLRISGLISLVFSLLFAVIFSKLLGGNIVRRIELLTMQCNAIAHGGVSGGLDYKRGDELDTLIRSFNSMSEQLAKSRYESKSSWMALEQSRNDLEKRVAERTRELSNLNEQLSLEISERKYAEEQKEALISELQDALSQVKTLRGLLPICSSCKKIRDDQGYWSQIETYIGKHSDAEFSHSICPDCAKKLYSIDI